MRSLIPVSVDDVDVHSSYAADWLSTGGVRVNFVASVDGAISAAGLSRGLQTPGDNRVFAALRDLADVVLVGSGTAAAEGYEPIVVSAKRQQLRAGFGLASSLPTAVVSGSLRLDPHAPLYADPSTVVFTTAQGDPAVRSALSADVVSCGESEVDLALALATLRARGFTRILCEGGPTLFGSLAGAGLFDELCLTVSPVLSGPGPGRLSAGSPWPDLAAVSLVGLLEEDGALLCRYRFLGHKTGQ